jgi:hypothetical protein
VTRIKVRPLKWEPVWDDLADSADYLYGGSPASEPEPDPIAHAAQIVSLRILAAIQRDGNLIHVIEAVEEHERRDPHLAPLVLALLRLIKLELAKKWGGQARTAHRDLAYINKAYQLQIERKALQPDGNLSKLTSAELDRLAGMFAKPGESARARENRKNVASSVISEYRAEYRKQQRPGIRTHRVKK